jgi:hypothetical protein
VSPNQGQMERNEVLRNKTSMLINTIFFWFVLAFGTLQMKSRYAIYFFLNVLPLVLGCKKVSCSVILFLKRKSTTLQNVSTLQNVFGHKITQNFRMFLDGNGVSLHDPSWNLSKKIHTFLKKW